jgi:hypothetical protein
LSASNAACIRSPQFGSMRRSANWGISAAIYFLPALYVAAYRTMRPEDEAAGQAAPAD